LNSLGAKTSPWRPHVFSPKICRNTSRRTRIRLCLLSLLLCSFLPFFACCEVGLYEDQFNSVVLWPLATSAESTVVLEVAIGLSILLYAYTKARVNKTKPSDYFLKCIGLPYVNLSSRDIRPCVGL